MKSPSDHYKKMTRNLTHARKIVQRVDKNECKSDLQHLKLRSYVLLCHAVIEEYIEDLGLDIALKSRRSYMEDGSISKSLVSLVTAKVLEEIKDKKAKRISSDLVRNLDLFSEEAFNLYRSGLASNHGIKPDNLAKIFVPIGFDPEAVDFALVNALKALGEKRGGLAHKFVIRQEMTLSSFETDLLVIKRDLIQFDIEACKSLALRMKAE